MGSPNDDFDRADSVEELEEGEVEEEYELCRRGIEQRVVAVSCRMHRLVGSCSVGGALAAIRPITDIYGQGCSIPGEEVAATSPRGLKCFCTSDEHTIIGECVDRRPSLPVITAHLTACCAQEIESSWRQAARIVGLKTDWPSWPPITGHVSR